MEESLKKELQKVATTIRGLTIDAIQRSNSGHPGLPLGCAEIGAYLYGHALKHNPQNPTWINRDRFVLSAGHGSMLLYSCLCLAGFNVSVEDLKNFRQLYSKTPGHPEYGETEGVEATTGPLGQGIGNAVGIALGYKILQEKFNTEEFKLIDNKIFCLAGDGCMMEGVASEASSLAGHLCLDNLIVIYDANKITLDGPLLDCCSEDTKARYRSYGWDVYEIDGHDFAAIDGVMREIRVLQRRPVLIVANTIIGKGSPHKAGTHNVHGSPLGSEEAKDTKAALGLSGDEFYISKDVFKFFDKRRCGQKEDDKKWHQLLDKWAHKYPKLFEELKQMKEKKFSNNLEETLKKLSLKNPIAGRSASQEVLNMLSKEMSFLYGGSADLSTSDKTFLKGFSIITNHDFKGRNIKYGTREFAMGAISNGLALVGFFLPFCGTFLTFSDYMRSAIRLASLSSLKVIYQFTHDSIFVGEDGPTHQPVEHIASLRAMPNLHVIRPADGNEVKVAWLAALEYEGPTAIILSRQDLPLLSGTEEGLKRGAYVIRRENKKADFTLFASGSELFLALEVATKLREAGKDVRVVSFPSFELFDKQSLDYRNSVVGGDIGKRVSIEAGVSFGWHKYIGIDGIAISVESFGFSAPAERVAEEFGFDVNGIVQKLI
jgi:transketolase